MSLLEARGLTCVYGHTAVLQNVDLAIQPGQVLALIGPNGAGKTTLLRALARLHRPATGTICLADNDIWRADSRAVARWIALTPQLADTLWPLSVEQIVTLGRTPHRGWLLPLTHADHAAIEYALERMGLFDLRTRLVTALSGGEQRRVMIARALAQQPKVLLLDEPLTYLDLKYQTETLELVHELANRDRLAVVVSLHDLNQAALCADQLALLAGGRLLAVGTPTNVLQPRYLSEAYGVQVSVDPHPLYNTPLVTPLLSFSQPNMPLDHALAGEMYDEQST